MQTIVLVYPPYRFYPPDWPEARPPLVLAHLYAVLESANIGRIEALDLDREFNYETGDIEYFLSKAAKSIKSFNPTVLCLSCKTAQFPFSALLIQKMKREHPEVKVFVGGWMPTLAPEHVLKASGCDAVIRGEGEKTLPELVRKMNADKWSIQGISYRGPRKDGRVIHNPNSQVLNKNELDNLPLPRYDALDSLERYWTGDRICFTVEASRGCMNNKCIFCWNSTKNCDTSWRAKNPKRVVKEIRWLNNAYGGKAFFFADDNFGAQSSWLESFISHVIAEFGRGDIGYVASMRIDSQAFRKAEILRSLSRSGLRTVFHGVESGSPRCWKTLEKHFQPWVNKNYIVELAKKEIKAGIMPMFSFIIGIPHEEKEDLEKTISLSRELADLGALISTQILSPNEGTVLYERYRDLIESYDVFHKLGRSENFMPPYYHVFGEKLSEFQEYLPDFKRVKHSIVY